MGGFLRGFVASVALAAASAVAGANSLTVSPILVDVQAPKATTSVTLESSGSEQINAQVRVFKWSIVNGKDQLVPTKDVVASPPAIKVKPNGKAVIRVVRRSKSPVDVEENYRLIVSEVPKAPKINQGVGIAFQYSIPAFFTPKNADADIQWSASASKGNLVIKAVNNGGRRMRITNLGVKKGSKTTSVSTGLSGYVLANSTRVWVLKGGAKGASNGSTVQIVAEGDLGNINATAVVGASN
jgi:fimbrial chaperone protein